MDGWLLEDRAKWIGFAENCSYADIKRLVWVKWMEMEMGGEGGRMIDGSRL